MIAVSLSNPHTSVTALQCLTIGVHRIRMRPHVAPCQCVCAQCGPRGAGERNSIVHSLHCFPFLSVANRRLRSALNSTNTYVPEEQLCCLPHPLLSRSAILPCLPSCIAIVSSPDTKFFARALRPCRKIGSGHLHYENWGKFTYGGQ